MNRLTPLTVIILLTPIPWFIAAVMVASDMERPMVSAMFHGVFLALVSTAMILLYIVGIQHAFQYLGG